jgi:hypothetical protein
MLVSRTGVLAAMLWRGAVDVLVTRLLSAPAIAGSSRHCSRPLQT